MDEEDAALIESILREDAKLNGEPVDDDSGWKTVSYPRRQRNNHHPPPAASLSSSVFRQIDQRSEDRHRRVVEAQRAALEAAAFPGGGSKDFSAGDDDDDTGDDDDAYVSGGDGNNAVVLPVKKPKPKVKKPKQPKVSVAEAAAKIDVDDLAAFLFDISGSYESQQDLQLMRFADYFGRAFATVGSAQFPWMKMIKESTVSKMVDIPLSHIPEAVYKTCHDWLSGQSLDALGGFVLWLWDGILADLASHQGTVKGSKKVAHQAPSKSQVALFVVLAITLRRKPDVLIGLQPALKDSQKYVGHDKLPVTVWVITQACQGDVVVGLYMWVHLLLPLLSRNSVNPQSRDLILQLVERILSTPKARQILLNGAVRKGERLVPPAALDTIMRLAFPSASTRIKATERFSAVYPTLKEVALAGPPKSKAMKQVSQKILSLAIIGAGEGVPELCKEASNLFVWCLTINPECYKQWDNLYLKNIEASSVILRKLFEERELRSTTSATLEPLKAALNSFKQKNKEALASKEYSDYHSSLKEADKYCNLLLARLSTRRGCLKGIVAVSLVFAVIAVVLSSDMHSGDFKQLLANGDFKQLLANGDFKQLLAKFNFQQ